MEGAALNLLSGRGCGIQIDKVGDQSVLIQLPCGPQNIQCGADRPAGDMSIVDGQNGMARISHVVDQRLAGGAEHLCNAPGRAVQKFKGLVPIHPLHVLSQYRVLRPLRLPSILRE